MSPALVVSRRLALHAAPRRCLLLLPVPHEFQGETVYYKSPTMHEVDDNIGDIQGKITDHQVHRPVSKFLFFYLSWRNARRLIVCSHARSS